MRIRRARSALGVLAGIAVGACGAEPRKPAPESPTVVVPRPPASPPAPAPAATVAPVAAPAVEARTATFDGESPSGSHAFRLVFLGGCPDDAGLCAGPVRLEVSKHGSAEVFATNLDYAMPQTDASGRLVVTTPAESDGAVVVGDFNFDGREDFAVHVGNDGPYGGPTYAVFLASDRAFAKSEALSELTEEHLGLFTVDEKRKRLITTSKSGCCWHTTEERAFKGDVLEPVLIVTEDATGSVLVETRQELIRGVWRRSTRRKPMPK